MSTEEPRNNFTQDEIERLQRLRARGEGIFNANDISPKAEMAIGAGVGSGGSVAFAIFTLLEHASKSDAMRSLVPITEALAVVTFLVGFGVAGHGVYRRWLRKN